MNITDTSLDCVLNRCGSCHYFQIDSREFRVVCGKIWIKYKSNYGSGKCKLLPASHIGIHSSCLRPGGKCMYKLWLELPSGKL